MMKRNDRLLTVQKYYDNFAKKYDKSRYHTEKQKKIDKTARSIYSRLAGNVRNKKHLDVGCGTGRIIVTMSEKGAKSTGVDTSEKMIAISRIKVPTAKFKVGSALKIPFPKNQFDLVTCSQVLTHLHEYSKPIAEMARVTKPGGRIIFDIRNRKNLRNFLNHIRIMLEPNREYDPHFTTKNNILRECKKMGLKVEDVYGHHYMKVHKNNWFCDASLIFSIRVR